MFHGMVKFAAAPFVAATILIADALTVGGLAVAALGVVVAAIVAFFTIRNLQRSYWRNLVDERDAEIVELKEDAEHKLQERALFAEEQRDIRHTLKTEIARLKGQLDLERAKHDLSEVILRIEMLETTIHERAPMFQEMAMALKGQGEILFEILTELRQQTLNSKP